MDLKKLESNFKKYTSPQAVKDFDAFLDAMPLNVGYNALIAAGLAWMLAGTAVWFASMETEKVSKLHTDLMEVEALRPPVPILIYSPVSTEVLLPLTKKIMDTYKGINIAVTGGDVNITATDTDYFPQFLAAISYLQRGGKNWKVRINTLCAGRECQGNRLQASLKVEMVRFGDPEVKKKE